MNLCKPARQDDTWQLFISFCLISYRECWRHTLLINITVDGTYPISSISIRSTWSSWSGWPLLKKTHMWCLYHNTKNITTELISCPNWQFGREQKNVVDVMRCTCFVFLHQKHAINSYAWMTTKTQDSLYIKSIPSKTSGTKSWAQTLNLKYFNACVSLHLATSSELAWQVI